LSNIRAKSLLSKSSSNSDSLLSLSLVNELKYKFISDLPYISDLNSLNDFLSILDNSVISEMYYKNSNSEPLLMNLFMIVFAGSKPFSKIIER
jgi:hypothetical protein